VNLDTVMREQARLVILKALRGQVDETLNSDLLVHERGAVSLIDAGTIKIATLTEKGARHLDREIAIEGVQRPSRPEI
jgi:hypothetical protein